MYLHIYCNYYLIIIIYFYIVFLYCRLSDQIFSLDDIQVLGLMSFVNSLLKFFHSGKCACWSRRLQNGGNVANNFKRKNMFGKYS